MQISDCKIRSSNPTFSNHGLIEQEEPRYWNEDIDNPNIRLEQGST